MAKWIQEDLKDGFRVGYKLNNILASTTTKFQTVDLVEFEALGRSLLIDGLIQSADVDEFVYHELLVHPAMLAHADPKRIYIGGGGGGGTVREVLRYKSVQRCVMVEIDEEVVDFCKKHMTDTAEALNSPKLELIIGCARKRLEDSTETFDVIIMDLSDPLEGGPCYQLYTKEFYQLCKSRLNPGGVFATQASEAGITNHHHVWSGVHSTLRDVFPKVVPYKAAVYSFMDEWGWHLALTDNRAQKLTAEEVDERISERIDGGSEVLKFLDGEAWQGVSSIPKQFRQTLNEDKIVMTTDNHRYMRDHHWLAK